LNQHSVVVQNLVKDYPKVRAVDRISFAVVGGEIFGLLGPNGAGKTTTIRMLLTLIKPTKGKASLYDIDVSKYPEKAREMAGYVPQDVSVDGDLTGYENILMYAKLYGVPRIERERRIQEVLEYLNLQERSNDMVNTYSGGMMRKLEIAQALVNRPRILFLDEPSIGLDPNAKRTIWELIKKLRNEFSTTIFLTTHDMNEAEVLCDRIGIMDKGRLVMMGEPSRLKSTVKGNVLSITSKTPGCNTKLEELGYSVIPGSKDNRFDLVVTDGESLIPYLLDTLKKNGVEVDAVSLQKPTLDDVFLRCTGTRIEGGERWTETRRKRRTFRRLTK
jgi:ABC-2 type transport system ATP-binding protein